MKTVFYKILTSIYILISLKWCWVSGSAAVLNFIDLCRGTTEPSYFNLFFNVFLILLAISILLAGIITFIIAFSKKEFCKLKVFSTVLLIVNFLVIYFMPAYVFEIPTYLMFSKLGLIDTYAVYWFNFLFSSISLGIVSAIWIILSYIHKVSKVEESLNNN